VHGRARSCAVALVFVVLLGSCATSKITTRGSLANLPRSIRAIAIPEVPGNLDDEVRARLRIFGTSIAPVNDVTSESDLMDASLRSQLVSRRIDAVIFVKKGGLDALGHPESATITIYEAALGQLVAVLSWQNGHGFGITHSISNVALSQSTEEAADEIATAIWESLQP
jgi:hypothetical protein